MNAGIPEVNGGFAVPNAFPVFVLLSLVGSTDSGTKPDQAQIPGDTDFLITQGSTDDMLSGVLELRFNRTNGFPPVGWASAGESLGAGMAPLSGHWLVRTASDFDGDGIPDHTDICPTNTFLAESVPTMSLGVNRFALRDGDGVFDTMSPMGKGASRNYTIDDTMGCSCTQIIEALGLGNGHVKFGCSISAMDDWVELVNP